MQLLSALPSRTLLLIEDVDAAFVGRSEGEDSKGGRDAGRGNNISFSGLLNALGGATGLERYKWLRMNIDGYTAQQRAHACILNFWTNQNHRDTLNHQTE